MFGSSGAERNLPLANKCLPSMPSTISIEVLRKISNLAFCSNTSFVTSGLDASYLNMIGSITSSNRQYF